MTKPVTYYISYGILGGSLKGKIMRRQLNKAGMAPVKSATEADIIIAHSAGCWLIDPRAHPRLVFYVGLPLRAANLKMFMTATRTINQYSVGPRHRFNHAWWGLFYGFSRAKRNLYIIRHAKTATISDFSDAQQVMIGNRYDPWLETPRMSELMDSKPWAFVSLSGSHDNIWEEPEKYCEIIEHYAKLLV
ncbi:MAG: hypothetical protein JWO41_804 [Candidatus Saccharibacteria bacterium]|nr:hypothetical protein [Candidatus Saccharibacteria bacterium]